jgi:predicted O-methyltransferase YrrM
VTDYRAAIAGVEGWLTDGQAQRLHERAAAVASGGRIVEIGSFRGRSTIVLALSAPDGVDVVAIDPHIGSDRGPQEIAAQPELGATDHDVFTANLSAAGVSERVRHLRKLSADAIDDAGEPIDLLWIDGAHRYGPARDDIVMYGAHVPPGGILAIHDAFSSVGVTLALARCMFFSRQWRYAGRSRSLAEYERRAGGLSSTLRQLASLPWFAWNVGVKVLTVLKIRRGPWPY